MNNYEMQELEYIRVQLVCLLVNENNAKQAHKIASLIRTIESWQHQIDKESEGENDWRNIYRRCGCCKVLLLWC